MLNTRSNANDVHAGDVTSIAQYRFVLNYCDVIVNVSPIVLFSVMLSLSLEESFIRISELLPSNLGQYQASLSLIQSCQPKINICNYFLMR